MIEGFWFLSSLKGRNNLPLLSRKEITSFNCIPMTVEQRRKRDISCPPFIVMSHHPHLLQSFMSALMSVNSQLTKPSVTWIYSWRWKQVRNTDVPLSISRKPTTSPFLTVTWSKTIGMLIISSLLLGFFGNFLGSDRSHIAHTAMYYCSVFHYSSKSFLVEILGGRMAA